MQDGAADPLTPRIDLRWTAGVADDRYPTFWVLGGNSPGENEIRGALRRVFRVLGGEVGWRDAE